MIVLGLLAALAVVRAEDASDLFLRAYQDFQNGEKLERDGDVRGAYSRYQSAARQLEEIVKAQPDWQPPVVEYRLKKTRENLERLGPQVASLPAVEEGPEGPLPRAEPVSLPPPAINTSRPLTGPTATPRPTPSTTGISGDTSSLRQQLAAAKAENNALRERLTRQEAELKSALYAVDKTKVTVVELKAQLAQAQDAMQNAIRDRDARPSSAPVDNAQLADLNSRILAAEADNEALIDENNRLLAKLELASKYIESADAGRKILEKDRKSIAKQRDEAIARTKKIKDNTEVIEKLTAERRDIEAKFAEEKKDLEKKLAEATDTERLDKLTAENKSLAGKLAEAEKKLAEAAAKPDESEKLLGELRSEINTLNDRLLESQAQIASREDQIAALARQLDESSGEIARLRLNPRPSADEKRTLVENDLLRAIILRQIKEQAERDSASQALDKELQALQVKSDTIAKEIEVLKKPAFRLSDDEKLLFKEPIAMLNETAPGSLAVTLAVAKPAGGFPEPLPDGGPESLPQESRALVDQARKDFESGRFGEAEKLYQEIVDASPNNAFALSNLGVTQIQARKLSAAEVALKKALEISPKDAFAATNLGVVYCKQGKFDEAMASLQEALAANEKDHIAQNYLGICYGEKGMKPEAEAAFQRSVELRPEYPDAHFNLAVLYATSQPPNLQKAREHYDLAVKNGSEPDPSLEQMLSQQPSASDGATP